MINRERIKDKIVEAVNNGYATHRVAQRILIESLSALAETIVDEIEKKDDHERSRKTKAANA